MYTCIGILEVVHLPVSRFSDPRPMRGQTQVRRPGGMGFSPPLLLITPERYRYTCVPEYLNLAKFRHASRTAAVHTGTSRSDPVLTI
eukprot:SAG31_NODE_1843_length_7106_cov_7.400742_2_plen_87_part_00